MDYLDKARLRFESKFIPIPFDGCWIWEAYCIPIGYGSFGLGRRTMMLAHRAAWILYRGPIPAGMNVLHKCDVRSCVNPDHLFLGTQSENVRDMFSKGRDNRAKGERQGSAKLTASQAAGILSDARNNREIADNLGITRDHVADIKRGRAWKHLPRPTIQ